MTVTPIGDVEAFPFSGGMLGGVEVEAPGVELLLPVVLEIRLDADAVAELRSALDSGLVVFGFGYDSVGDGVYADVAVVSDDLSTIQLRLSSFSGHGAGVGVPEDLDDLPVPSDPFQAAVQELVRILNSGGAPGDPADQIEADIADVLRVLFNNMVLPAFDAALSDPASLEDAVTIGVHWSGLVSAVSSTDTDLFGRGGLLTPQANQLETAIWEAMRAIFNDLVKPAMDRAVSDPSSLFDATKTAMRWSQLVYAFATEDGNIWGGGSGPFPQEGQQLEDTFWRAWQNAWDTADNKCQTSGTPEDLQHLIDLDALATALSESDRSRLASYILTPEGFCLRLKITTIEKPEKIMEGETATVGFWIEADNQASLTPGDLAEVGITAVFTPDDTNIATASPERAPAPTLATYYETTITAVEAIPGSNSELELTLTIEALGGPITLAEEAISIDIIPGEITCTGLPASLTNTDDSPERIVLTFDGDESCSLLTETEDVDYRARDIPDAVIAFDTDPEAPGWDDAGVGDNWTRNMFGEDEDSGTYTITARRIDTGESYTIVFTIQVSGPNDNRTMIIQDVTITPASN